MMDLLDNSPIHPPTSSTPFRPFHVATHSYYAILASSSRFVSMTSRTLPSLLILSTPWLLEWKQRAKLHHHSPST